MLKVSRLRQAAQFAKLALLSSLLLIGNSVAFGANSQSEKWSLRPLCALWDDQAKEVIARRLTESHPRDTDLRTIVDDLVRMQQARQSCDLGRIRTACKDYIAVMRNVGGTTGDYRGSASICPSAMTDEPGFEPQRTRASND